MEERELDRLWAEIRESESRLIARLDRTYADVERHHAENLVRFEALERWHQEMKFAAKVTRIMWAAVVAMGAVIAWLVDHFWKR